MYEEYVDDKSENIDYFEISEDLQRDILNLMLNDRDFLINSMSLVKNEYFVFSSHRNLCKTIQNYFNEYNSPITIDILKQEILSQFKDSNQLAINLTELDIISERSDEALKEKEYLKKAVIDFARAQAMKTAILKSVELIETKQYDEIEKNIKEALLVAPEMSLGTDIFENVSERYQRIISEEQGERFTVGSPTVDRDLKGGIGRKEVGMIFANSGVGKSLWCSKVAIENLIRNKKVLYISCEMSEERVCLRTDSMLSRIPINNLTTQVPLLRNRLQEIKGITNGQLKIKEFPAGSAKISDLRAYSHKLYNYTGFFPDLVILDYIDECQCSNSRLSTYEGQYHTLREFRGWMSSDNIAGFTATQANRSGGQVKIITEGEIGDSYAKIRVVDAAWSLNQNPEEKAKYLARLYAVKHRNARSKYIVFIKIHPETLKMTEISEEQYTLILGGEAPADVCDESTV